MRVVPVWFSGSSQKYSYRQSLHSVSSSGDDYPEVCRTKRRIHTCSDRTVAPAELAKTTNKSFLVWERMQVLGKLCEPNNVTLDSDTWASGDTGQ
jgi:hypothetical protein